MTLSAAATQPGRSWSWLIALGVAYVVFRLVAPWLRKIRNPSPTPALPRGQRVKVQATVGVTEDEPTDEPEVGWWGRIREVGGVRFRQAQQIVTTGSHELPPAAEVEDVDVPLDDEVEEQTETIEEYVARLRTLGVAHNEIVRLAVRHYAVSESTAKRRIREVDEASRPAA